MGELLQIDASIHNWFGDSLPKATLHGAIDDATGTVMGLFFDGEETLKGYYEMMWQILNEYGIPEAFLRRQPHHIRVPEALRKEPDDRPRRAHQLQAHAPAAGHRAHHHLHFPGERKLLIPRTIYRYRSSPSIL